MTKSSVISLIKENKFLTESSKKAFINKVENNSLNIELSDFFIKALNKSNEILSKKQITLEIDYFDDSMFWILKNGRTFTTHIRFTELYKHIAYFVGNSLLRG